MSEPTLTAWENLKIAENKEILDLDQGEQVIKVMGRPKKSYYVPQLSGAGIFSIIFWIIYFTAYTPFMGLIPVEIQFMTQTIIWVFPTVLYTIFVIQMCIGPWFVRGHLYFVTNTRIVMYRKFVSILFREIDFKRITDLVLRQSMWGRVFNFGNLMPVTAGVEAGMARMGLFSIEGVKDVFKVRNDVLDQIRILQDKIMAKYGNKN